MQMIRHTVLPVLGQRCFAAKVAAVRWSDILLPTLVTSPKRATPGRCNARRGRGGTRQDDAGAELSGRRLDTLTIQPAGSYVSHQCASLSNCNNRAGSTATLEANEEAEGLSASGRDGIDAAEGRRSAGQPSTSGREAPGQEFIDLGVDDRLTVGPSMPLDSNRTRISPRLVGSVCLSIKRSTLGCDLARHCLWRYH